MPGPQNFLPSGLCLIKMSNGSISPLKLQLEAFLAAPSLLSPSLRPAHREGEPLHSPVPVPLFSWALPPQLDSLICERKPMHLVRQAGFYCL